MRFTWIMLRFRPLDHNARDRQLRRCPLMHCYATIAYITITNVSVVTD